jgi:DNA ligase 1
VVRRVFPDHRLDGELWGGRKRFQRTVGIVKRQDESPLWKDLLYMVFDAPAHPRTFEERMAHARTIIDERNRTFQEAPLADVIGRMEP